MFLITICIFKSGIETETGKNWKLVLNSKQKSEIIENRY